MTRRDVGLSVKNPVLPCHSRRLGMTFGAGLRTSWGASNKAPISESTTCRGIKFVEMKTIPRNAVMQKAAIFFLKNCTPLCPYVYQKMPHKTSIYLPEQRGQCLNNRCDQRAMSLTTSSLEEAPI